ncbi:putative RNaseH ribonuclease [Delftia phage PhiW-14]|uniref:ribonuclease H n=1 Tax=Delftia phage PhiW-14 TaxID=665032 RepID=C9DGJ5_BPW14|nr:Rnase H [Delftia phage PhiW-14]ACV50246.1 putative RNaseH ribonuclease [Delftia phage PhiW-14]
MKRVTDVHVYTDGSSKHNGKPECVAGWSMVIPNLGDCMYARYGQLAPPSSNNRGEAMGVIAAAEMFARAPDFRAVIYTDSQYIQKACTEWRGKWALTQYDGVKNIDMLLPLFNIIDRSINKPKILWVKGHAGDPGNELADQYAGYGMRGIRQMVESTTQNIQWVEEADVTRRYRAWA